MNQPQTNEIESLKSQIDYMREIGCHKLADLLAEDLEREQFIERQIEQERQDREDLILFEQMKEQDALERELAERADAIADAQDCAIESCYGEFDE